jgi:aquaporin Z
MPTLARRATAELLGTFALVFFGAGAVVMDAFPGARYGLMGIALVHAVVLSVAVSMTMNISGGHLNPAVTAGMLATRRIGATDAVAYIGAQLGGAVLAVLAARWAMPTSVGDLALWGTPQLHPSVGLPEAIGVEALMTFFLMSAVLGTAVLRTAPRIGGFGIGLTLVFAIMVGGPLTGAALNPARAFGPALVSGAFTAHAAYWIGPIVGAVIAAFVWRWMVPDEQ